MTDPEFVVRPERTQDCETLEQLAARAFGPGRFARTAHRVREAVEPVDALSFTAWAGETLAGAIRFTAIHIGGRPGALLLGPLMVDNVWAGRGCGRALMAAGLERARELGYALVLLVGDEPYYARFGFCPVPPRRIILPGPVDPKRLLALELAPGALEDFAGAVEGVSVPRGTR